MRIHTEGTTDIRTLHVVDVAGDAKQERLGIIHVTGYGYVVAVAEVPGPDGGPLRQFPATLDSVAEAVAWFERAANVGAWSSWTTAVAWFDRRGSVSA